MPNAQIIKLLSLGERLTQQQQVFDLMIQFFDRAHEERNHVQQRLFINAAAKIHRGASHA